MSKVLIIDDDQYICELLRAVFDHGGHQVSIAPNGEEGLERCRAESPDLVVTDIFMPEMDGIEFIQALRRENARTKVIAVSGNDTFDKDDYLSMAKDLGADAVLTKPLDSQDALSLAEELLQS